jgi:hypothetical protein
MVVGRLFSVRTAFALLLTVAAAFAPLALYSVLTVPKTDFVIDDFSWSPRGDYALALMGERTVYRFDGIAFVNLTDQLMKAGFGNTPWSFWGISWKPGGNNAFLFGQIERGYRIPIVVRFDGENFTTIYVPEEYHWVRELAWTPNGSYALALGDSGYGMFDGEHFSNFIHVGWSLWYASWHPSGSYALVTARGMFEDDWMLLKFDGRNFTTLYKGPLALRTFSWKPDGNYALAAASSMVDPHNLVAKFDCSAVSVLFNVSSIAQSIMSASWSPDGRYALIVGLKTLLKFDGQNFTQLSTGVRHFYSIYIVSWKPDGRYAYLTGYHVFLRYDGSEFTSMPPTEKPNYAPFAWTSWLAAAGGLLLVALSIIVEGGFWDGLLRRSKLVDSIAST